MLDLLLRFLSHKEIDRGPQHIVYAKSCHNLRNNNIIFRAQSQVMTLYTVNPAYKPSVLIHVQLRKEFWGGDKNVLTQNYMYFTTSLLNIHT